MGKYFGTDGFRGEANKDLTVEHAFKIGRYLGWFYGKDHKAKVVIGKDTRRSSYMFESALCAGLTASGADAYLLHVTTTPSVSYVARADDFDCGIMISASHNPYHDNGIKLLNGEGEKMDDTVLDGIEAYLDSGEELPYATLDAIGRTVDYAAGRNRYIGYLISLATRSYKGKKVGLDCANGSTWMMAKSVFDALGADTFVINNHPDGLNINVDCGSTHIGQLCEYVKNGGMAAGFAFDGDADRCLAVDENGRVIDGDRIIAVLAKRMKEKKILKGDAAVVTVMSNLGFHDFMKQNGMKTVCAKVGDRYVLEEMQRSGYNIGGEQSGHIIMLDHATTGDGQLTAAMLIKVMTETGKSLAQLCEGIEDYPQLLVNVKITESGKGKWNNVPAIMDCISAAEKELGGSGRVLVRESGTEPLVRVMVEGKDMDMVKRLADSIAEEVKRSLT